jgi:hypothetical protein
MLIYIQCICRRRFLDGNREETVNVLDGQYKNDCWIHCPVCYIVELVMPEYVIVIIVMLLARA